MASADSIDPQKLLEDKAFLEQFLDAYEARDFPSIMGMVPRLLTIAEFYDVRGIQPKRSFTVYGLLSQAYGSLGNYNLQLELAQKCLAAAERTCEDSYKERAYGTVGNAYFSQGKVQEAIRMHEQSLKLAVASQDLPAQSGSYGNLGNAYNAAGEVRKAIEMHQQSLDISIQMEDLVGQSKSYGNLGNCYFSLGKLDLALEMHKKDLEISEQLQNLDGVSCALGNLAKAYSETGDYPKALEYLQRRLEIAEFIGDKGAQARAYLNLAGIKNDLGESKEAISIYERGLKIVEESGDFMTKSFLCIGLGNSYLALGKVEQATERFEQSLDIAEQIGFLEGQLAACGSLGNVYGHCGYLDKAIRMHEKSVELSQVSEDLVNQGKAYGNLGSVYRQVGQYGKAIAMHEKDLAIAMQIESETGQAMASVNLGNCYQSLGRLEKAAELYEKARAIAHKQGNTALVASILGNLGSVYKSQGNMEQAMSLQQDSLRSAVELEDPRQESIALLSIGHIHKALGDREEAKFQYQKSLDVAKRTGDVQGCFLAHTNLGGAHLHDKQCDLAVQHFEESLAACESLQHQLNDRDTDRISIFETQRSCYLKYQMALMEQGREEEALVLSERSKARALDYLMWKTSLGFYREMREKSPSWADVSEMVAAERSALLEYSILNNECMLVWLVAPCGSLKMCQRVDCRKYIGGFETLPTLLQQVFCALNARGHGFVQAVADSAVQARASSDTTVPREDVAGMIKKMSFGALDGRVSERAVHEALVAQLGEDELALQEAIGMMRQHREVYAWLQTLTADSVLSEASDHDMNQTLVAILSHVVGWEDLKDLTEETLRDVCGIETPCIQFFILEKIAELFDPHRLLRRLHALLVEPIAAELCAYQDLLIVPSMELFAVPWAALLDDQGKYLVESHSLRVAPSLSVAWQAARSVAHPHKPQSVVVGDPQPLAFSGFRSLPFAAKEARFVAERLGALALTGSRATVGQVRRRMHGADWVHMACHGWLERLALVLAPEGGDGGPDDEGLLDADAVQRDVRLRGGSTAVLSACDSGMGDIHGEGVVGLARAFLAAGAAAVVMSLWSVADRSTMLLMQPFYFALAAGSSVPAALRFAMVMMLRHGGDCAGPRSWAAFLVAGARTHLPHGFAEHPTGSGTTYSAWTVDEVQEWCGRAGLPEAVAVALAQNEVDGPTLAEWAGVPVEEVDRALEKDLVVRERALREAFCAAWAALQKDGDQICSGSRVEVAAEGKGGGRLGCAVDVEEMELRWRAAGSKWFDAVKC